MTFRRQLPPEIIRLVMECLEDSEGSLRSAILVNRSWATQDISVLWHHPPVGALALLTGGRQQYYANQVRELVVDEARCDFAFLKIPKATMG